MENTVEKNIIERTVSMTQPRTLVFGCGCVEQLAQDIALRGFNNAMVVTAKAIRRHADSVAEKLKAGGLSILIDDSVNEEPTIAMLEQVLAHSNSAKIDVIIGIGGGSVLDLAKLVAALRDGEQSVTDCFGIGKLAGRKTYLVCLPTTSGTGSEVSPNAILLDETDDMKKGIVSPYLVPDASYIDPTLTLTTPDNVTASTGIDALTHCIEAYANRFAHPLIDLFALKGIELIAGSLEAAYQDGENLRARSALSLGSMYGGLCLGPVNTAAVHALAYPLGGRYHVPHGLSNAVLLPDVMEFNLSAAPQRYAQIALAMGCEKAEDNLQTAQRGIDRVREICRRCGITSHLFDFGVLESDIPEMAESAMAVTRLLKNNLKSVTQKDAERIYQNLLSR